MSYRITWPGNVGDPHTVDTFAEVIEYIHDCVNEGIDENEQALTEGDGYTIIDTGEPTGWNRDRDFDQFMFSARPVRIDEALWSSDILSEFYNCRARFYTLQIREIKEED